MPCRDATAFGYLRGCGQRNGSMGPTKVTDLFEQLGHTDLQIHSVDEISIFSHVTGYSQSYSATALNKLVRNLVWFVKHYQQNLDQDKWSFAWTSEPFLLSWVQDRMWPLLMLRFNGKLIKVLPWMFNIFEINQLAYLCCQSATAWSWIASWSMEPSFFINQWSQEAQVWLRPVLIHK